MKPEYIKKILIVKLCCLGDVIFMTPVINNLKLNYPDARISVLISEWVKPLIPYLENVDEVIIYNGPFSGSAFKKIADTIKIIFKLRSENFDMAFLGHRNNLYGRLLSLSGIKYRMGFKGTSKINLPAEYEEEISEPARYLKVLEKNSIKIFETFITLKQKKDKRDLKGSMNIPQNKLIIGIFPFGGSNPGTQMNIKRWGLNNFLSLAERSSKLEDVHIILFEGTYGDEKIGNIKKMNNVTINNISMDAVSLCNVFVCGDTGPLHMAAAFGSDTLSIFGPTHPKLFAPSNNSRKEAHHKYVFKNVECSPCHTPVTAIERNNKKYWQNGTFICHTGTLKCMKEISVEDAYKPLVELINLQEIEKL